MLAAAIGSAYIETAIETYVCVTSHSLGGTNSYHSAQARIETADPKVEPSLQVLGVIRSVDLICHLWQQYVNMALLPLASTSVTVRREMVVFNNQTISRIEGAVNHVTQPLTDCKPSFHPNVSHHTLSTICYSCHRLACSPTVEAEADGFQASKR